MEYIERETSSTILKYLDNFPVVALIGTKQ